MTDELLLPGPDAANPLGFLCALGTLAVCDHLRLGPRMRWEPAANSFRPRLSLDAPRTSEALCEEIATALRDDVEQGPPAWCAAEVIRRPAGSYREFAQAAAASAAPGDRASADFAAACASEVVTAEKSDEVEPTRFSFANGQSGKYLLRDYRELAASLTPDLVRSALFASWAYHEASKALRWDPRERRLYALRADDPGTSTVYTSHGGNALAFWGLTLLPSFPKADGTLVTTAFARHRAADGKAADFFTWPVWGHAATPDVVRGLLALPMLADAPQPQDKPAEDEGRRVAESAADRAALGLLAAYRSGRINYQKGLFFTQPVAI